MADNATLARPYAVAAFDYATEHDAVDQWVRMLDVLASVCADEAAQGFMSRPGIGSDQLVDLVTSVGGDVFDDAGRNFLRVLADNGRLALGESINAVFAQLRASSEAKVPVEVTSAYKVSAAHKNAIAQSVAQRLGREVDVDVHIDRSLKAGVVVRVGDLVIDGSVRGRLERLSLELA